MKKKTIIVVSAVVILVVGAAVFYIAQKNSTKLTKERVLQFIGNFNEQLKCGNIDSAKKYFENTHKKSTAMRLVKILAGKTGLNGESKPRFKLTIDPASSDITILNSEFASATVSVDFSADSGVIGKQSKLIFKIHKRSTGDLKITEVNVDTFYTDYTVYADLVGEPPLPDSIAFSKQTLSAFKTAKNLGAIYDTVPWFQHVDKQTYYWVVKGKWNIWQLDSVLDGQIPCPWKMGLVNPQIKEIIPPEFDVIHNIGLTLDNLIEVEKNRKRGFYNTDGKLVLPCIYDDIFPLVNVENIALLRKDNDYFYLKKDFTLSDKLVDFNVADVLKNIRSLGEGYTLSQNSFKNVMEYNDRLRYASLIVPPSYLADWQILRRRMNFLNPMRKEPEEVEMVGGSETYKVKYNGHTKINNWLEAIYFWIADDFLDSRAGIYNYKNVVLIDKKRNRIIGDQIDLFDGHGREGGAMFSGLCNENDIKPINDTLVELKTTADIEIELPNGGVLTEGPVYHYLYIRDGKIVVLPNKLNFSFTKYVKLNDSYLNGCYVLNNKAVSHLTTEMLQYAKNEIFAQYDYKFKNPFWTLAFHYRYDRSDEGKNTNVDDSLTAIDKYNINWLDQKIKAAQKQQTKAATK